MHEIKYENARRSLQRDFKEPYFIESNKYLYVYVYLYVYSASTEFT